MEINTSLFAEVFRLWFILTLAVFNCQQFFTKVVSCFNHNYSMLKESNPHDNHQACQKWTRALMEDLAGYFFLQVFHIAQCFPYGFSLLIIPCGWLDYYLQPNWTVCNWLCSSQKNYAGEWAVNRFRYKARYIATSFSGSLKHNNPKMFHLTANIMRLLHIFMGKYALFHLKTELRRCAASENVSKLPG